MRLLYAYRVPAKRMAEIRAIALRLHDLRQQVDAYPLLRPSSAPGERLLRSGEGDGEALLRAVESSGTAAADTGVDAGRSDQTDLIVMRMLLKAVIVILTIACCVFLGALGGCFTGGVLALGGHDGPWLPLVIGGGSIGLVLGLYVAIRNRGEQ